MASGVKPVRTPESNLCYRLPSGDEENDLPCERVPLKEPDESGRVPTAIRSTWELDSDDMAAVMQTRRVELTVWGEPVPPVALGAVLPGTTETTAASEGDPPPVTYAHLRRAIGLLVTELRGMGESPAPASDVMRGLETCLLATQGELPHQ